MSTSVSIKASEAAPANADLVLFKKAGEFVPRPFGPSEFSGEEEATAVFHGEERREIYVGLGGPDSPTRNSFRKAGAIAIRKGTLIGSTGIVIDVSQSLGEVGALVEGLVLGAYEFTEFKSADSGKKPPKITLVGPKKSLKEIRDTIRRSTALAEAVNHTRDLGNRPGSHVTPDSLAASARTLANETGMRCRVWNRAALEREGFGGLLAVGGGSAREPRLIRLDYTTQSKNAPTIAVVGKAITFDSGGICIKPAEHLDEMKFDKMGGCVVLGVLKAVAALGLPCNLVGILAAAENMTGPEAYRPGDIVRTYDGRTVEVINTDAEGRIVLADALGFVRTKIKPDLVIDLATLTGACVVALGEDRAGLFTRDTRLAGLAEESGDETGERVWRLPMGEEFEEPIRSKIADVRNLGTTRWGGASTAATFLAHWTGGIPHVHLDIAGPAMAADAKPFRAPGATGFGVRLVFDFLERWCRPEG